MEVLDAIMKRRSIRHYTSKEISDETVHELIKAAMYAPSAVNKQPWHFIVLKDKNTFLSINEFHPSSLMLKEASVAILVCAEPKLAHDEGYWQIDCSAATQNMLLAATGLGLGSCWIGIYPRLNRVAGMRSLLNIPEDIVPFSLVSLGYPNEVKPMPERFMKERIRYARW